MKKAIFLDRDGVISNNENHYYIWKPEQLEYVDGIFENLKLLTERGFKLFIVSNQGGISKGLYSKADTLELHRILIECFRKHRIEITDIAFCPHHPDVEQCLCRKPKSLLLEKLMARHHISAADSYFIGDSETDMEAARTVGIAAIKTEPNRNIRKNLSVLIE